MTPEQPVRVPSTSRTTWWVRRRNYFLLAALAIGTMQWALKQLGWLFGWSGEPVQGHLGQVFDALVILAAGIVLMVFAIRQIRYVDHERQAALERLHDKAVKARAGDHLRA